MTEPSPLWYAARGLGLTLLVLTSASVVLGIMNSTRWRAEGWPRFVTAELHRNVALVAVALLPLHGLTVVLDSFAHLGLRDILVPFATAYRPLWLGLGVLAGELLVAVVVVSLIRERLGHRLWRLTHWAVYVAWPLALLHGLGTGSDTRSWWGLLLYVACACVVLLAVLVRLSLHRAGTGGWRLLTGGLASAGLLGIAIFTMLGPLQPGWAAAAGTPPQLLGSHPSTSTAAIPTGLDDQLTITEVPSGSGDRMTLTDVRDPSLQLVVDMASSTATAGQLQALESGSVVCTAQASLGPQITATCGSTHLVIDVQTRGRRLIGELVTEPA